MQPTSTFSREEFTFGEVKCRVVLAKTNGEWDSKVVLHLDRLVVTDLRKVAALLVSAADFVGPSPSGQ